MRRAVVFSAAVALSAAGCIGPGGPGRYGRDGYPLHNYSTVGIVPTGREQDALRMLRERLREENLWKDVHRSQTTKDLLMIWATPDVHLRVEYWLARMRDRPPQGGR